MEKPEYNSEKFEALRQKAEEKLENTFNKVSDIPDVQDVEAIKKLMHELQVNQTELEMQNDELQQTQQQLKASEKRYADLYDSAPISYITLDQSGKMLDVNLTAAEKFDVEKPYLINKSFYDFIDKGDRDQLHLHLVAVFKSETHQQCELRISPKIAWDQTTNDRSRKPEDFWALLESKVFEDNAGNRLCRTMLSDITTRKNIEQELRKEKKKAEQNDYLKSAFLANMSHEIRTPMNGIIGFTDLLRQSGLNSEEQEYYLDIIEKSGQRLMNTVNDIIEVSKVEAGISTVELKETDINQMIRDLVGFFEPEAENKDLTLTLDQQLPESSKTIFTDESKLESIITNFIKNAIKYTDTGQIHVGCSLKEDNLEFYVKDTGVGVPPHRQEAIFNRFEQADIADKRAFQGSGLGLALIKSYVEMLEGKIDLESVEGEGSTFYVTLPFKPAEAPIQPSDIDQGTTLEDIYKEINAYNQYFKILVAEDDQASFLVLSKLLKKIKCEIFHAATGTETVEKCRQNPDLDLIMMDIKMPGIDGYEATHKIREFNSSVYIVAQTAYALKGDEENSLESGIDDYITKPVQEKALMESILKGIKSRSQTN